MFKRIFLTAIAAGFLAVGVAPSTTAEAKVVAKVNIASQTMNVYVNGRRAHSWAISSGKRGYRTPRGSYRPTRTYRRYYSKKYHGSPMPHSVFFRGGYAIHGTYAVKRLGRRASHGCIRLAPGAAARFYSLVKRHGRGGTRILIR